MEKKISYLARDFESIKGELINFTNKYYPELSDNLNDSSVGSWLIDLVSAVGDDLSYHTDRMYQETNIDSAKLRSSVLNVARMNGVKIPGPKCSICEVEISILLPTSKENSSQPNWSYAPVLKRGSTVGNNSHQFEILEDVDFHNQFNSEGISNRKFVPMRDANGYIVNYKITKTVLVYGGFTRIYKKILSKNDVVPFMEVIIPEDGVCNVESIIFKENGNLETTPSNYEFFIDEEEFIVPGQDISTYRYFEVNSLSDQYRFGSKTSFIERTEHDDFVVDVAQPVLYEDYAELNEDLTTTVQTSRYCKGQWKSISQKFITEYTDNNFLKITFGCGTDLNENALQYTTHGNYVASKIINNNMLGLLPKSGWVMYILYRVGGGSSSNLAPGSINQILLKNFDFPHDKGNMDDKLKSDILNSMKVINNVSSIGGKDIPSTDEIKFMTKYYVNNQDRCITLKDYKSKVMQIPSKYGCPFRCSASEENNKILLSLLTTNSKGQLTTVVPEIMAQNIVEYLSHYKSLTDYVEVHSGKVYNLGFEVDIFIDKNYVKEDVIKKVINIIQDYFDISKHDMGADIFVGDLEKEINLVDGVIGLIELRVFSLYGGKYSMVPCPLPERLKQQNNCGFNVNSSLYYIEDAQSFEIDLEATDHVLYNDIDSMFEIKNPAKDIQIKVKMR